MTSTTKTSIQGDFLCALPFWHLAFLIPSMSLVPQLKKRILEQVLGCASIFRLLLEHFAHKLEELLFSLSLKKRDGLSNSEVLQDQILADEFSIVIKKWAAKVLKCVSTRLSFGVLDFGNEGQLAETPFPLKESLRRWYWQTCKKECVPLRRRLSLEWLDGKDRD
ncbi:hypothetical protein BKA65DRAFT_508253 [Rhexocercosporidium sp. MPI-PUGE-AT-0058]|nr:hypothetical protein BKA65DRAFT_508253 [Rhexocercosporidium sp. MPI-PUGE-AT-0058]